MAMMVQGFQRTQYPELFDEMFRLRKKVFHDEKGWDVNIVDGEFEIDEFDRDDTVYLLSLDESRNIVASVRLLSTATPHMFAGPFAHMFPDVQFSSPLIWEATRWAGTHDRRIQPNGVSYSACDICLSAARFGLEYGVAQFVGVFEPALRRIYRRCGMPARVISTIQDGPYRGISAGIWDVSAKNEQAILRATGLESEFAQAA